MLTCLKRFKTFLNKKSASEESKYRNVYTYSPHSRCSAAVGRGFEPPTERLAVMQKENFVVNPYITFIPNSPPPRQEGMSANFITLQCSDMINVIDHMTKVIDKA